MTDYTTRAAVFRSLHHGDGPLVLVNAWDVASARIVEAAGGAAIATTSAGIAWSLGAPDGDALGRELTVELVARICAATSLPVTADIESGYGATPDEVGETVRSVAAAGAVGVNIEDTNRSGQGPLRTVEEQGRRLTGARDAAPALFLNARIDTYLTGTREFGDTVDRATAYLAAGADGIFIPGVIDPNTIAALVKAIDAPINVMAGPGAPPVAELAKLGVARVSLGSAVAQAAYAVVQRSATEALTTGTYGALTESLDFGILNGLLSNGH
jgi:2-methylisocitrate lyase-like PEP mutase family enzyme